MKRYLRKLHRVFGLQVIKLAPIVSPSYAHDVALYFYGKWGMKFVGRPKYISSRVNFDGTDYGLIELHDGVTISSYVRVLTHDWSLYTVAKAMGHFSDHPIGKIKGVSIGPYSFVGTGSIVMPGTTIGRGCIIGSGTVVRGHIPDFSIVIGSPGKIIGDSRDFVRAQFARQGIDASGLDDHALSPPATPV